MKSQILLSLILQISGVFAFAGSESSGGGSVISCPAGVDRPPLQLLDFAEAIYGPSRLQISYKDTRDYKTINKLLLQKIAQQSISLANALRKEIEGIEESMMNPNQAPKPHTPSLLWVSHDLPPVNDLGNIAAGVLPPDCEIKYLGVYDDLSIRLTVHQDLFDQLPELDKSGWIWHEAVYRLARVHRSDEVSQFVRSAVGSLFSVQSSQKTKDMIHALLRLRRLQSNGGRIPAPETLKNELGITAAENMKITWNNLLSAENAFAGCSGSAPVYLEVGLCSVFKSKNGEYLQKCDDLIEFKTVSIKPGQLKALEITQTVRGQAILNTAQRLTDRARQDKRFGSAAGYYYYFVLEDGFEFRKVVEVCGIYFREIATSIEQASTLFEDNGDLNETLLILGDVEPFKLQSGGMSWSTFEKQSGHSRKEFPIVHWLTRDLGISAEVIVAKELAKAGKKDSYQTDKMKFSTPQ